MPGVATPREHLQMAEIGGLEVMKIPVRMRQIAYIELAGNPRQDSNVRRDPLERGGRVNAVRFRTKHRANWRAR